MQRTKNIFGGIFMRESTKRKFGLSALILSVALVLVCAQFVCGVTASAEDNENIGRTYYYEELKNSDMAQRFYRAMEDMAAKGHFKKGTVEYDLLAEGVLTQAEVEGYVDNNSAKVPVALGAARDAFYMDHPDLFYVDVYKLYLSAGMKDGKYAAYIGTGNADNYYTENTFKSETEVVSAITAYESALDAAVAAAKAGGGDSVSQIKAANEYIASNVKYDYGANKDAHDNVAYDGNVNTAYGALVNKKAMCGGYARAFKAIMDKLNIPCTLVQGYAYSGIAPKDSTAGYEAHMWNAVRVDGLWYGVDPTYNSSNGNRSRYLLVGDDMLSVNHVADGVISSSGFELVYPALRPLDYGVNTDKNGFTFADSGMIDGTELGYLQNEERPEQYTLVMGVAYNGMNAAQLKEEGKYFAYRYKTDKGWSLWASITALIRDMGYDETEEADKIASFFVGDYTKDMLLHNVELSQYAVFDYEPEGTYVYDSASLTDAHIIAVSIPYANDAYMKYIPAPYVKKITPNGTGMLKNFDPQPVTIQYSEKLVFTEGTSENDLRVLVTGQHDDIAEYVSVTDAKWNAETNTLSFIFTPSKYYAHNCETYQFVPSNLVGEKSGKTPEAGGLTYKMKQVVCSKIFNDGRLYMQVFGQPKFVSADDESLNKFMDKNGQPIVGNQRSQLMLVVNSPSKTETEKMEDALLSDDTLGLDATDVKASSTYEIDLQVCGVVQRVPEGSYMQVGFGFPEGYGPEDAGVTFTVYHYTRDAHGAIESVEEVPCVISEYGIIATVKSFSPFMICAIDSSKASAAKAIYANVNGSGGKVDNQNVTAVEEGDSVQYTVTADAGYKVNRVLLNGQDVTAKMAGDKLTLTYADLAKNNELEVTFVSERVAAYRTENGFVVAQPRLIVTQDDMITAVAHDVNMPQAKTGLSTAAIVTIVIVCVVVVSAVVVVLVWFFLNKNKNGNGKSGNGGGKKRTVNTSRPATAAKSR